MPGRLVSLPRESLSRVAGLLLCGLLVGGCATQVPQTSAPNDAAAANAPVDEIVVQGMTLKGKIKGFDADAVRFEPNFAKGELKIAYANIQNFKADGEYHLVLINGTGVKGRIEGMTPAGILIAEDGGRVRTVEHENIGRVVRQTDSSQSWLTRLRERNPHWKATLELNVDTESGAVEKNEVGGRLKIERRMAPTRQVFDLNYAHEINQTPDQPDTKKVVKDELTIKVHNEWDRTERAFIFVNPTLERDAPRGIELRGFGAIGPGYRAEQSSRFSAQGQIGAGWVYEQFSRYPNNDFFAAYVGVEFSYTFRRGVVLDVTLDYYPSLEPSKASGLFRGALSLRFPIEEKFYVNLRFAEKNDKNPAPEVGDNKFTTSLGLSFVF